MQTDETRVEEQRLLPAPGVRNDSRGGRAAEMEPGPAETRQPPRADPFTVRLDEPVAEEHRAEQPVVLLPDALVGGGAVPPPQTDEDDAPAAGARSGRIRRLLSRRGGTRESVGGDNSTQMAPSEPTRRQWLARAAGITVGGIVVDAATRSKKAAAQTTTFVDTTSNQTIGGVKTFTSPPVVPAGAFPEAAVAGLAVDLAAKAPASGPFAPTSLGASAPTRYVGGTASGAPTAGTFAVGDFVIDQTGKIWICTVAGTPGTWAQQVGVDLTSAQTVGGVKSFTSPPVVPPGAFPEAAVAGLVTDLAAKAPAAGPFAPTSPGASAPTRYVGGTASGAPTAGTFAVGDFVIDQTGKVWICTVGGTPGTWVQQSGSGVDLTTDQTVAGVKTFTSPPVVPAGAFPESAVAGLVADLAAKAPAIVPGTYAETPGGVLTLTPNAPVAALRLGAPSLVAADSLQRSGPAQMSLGGTIIKEFSFGPVSSNLSGAAIATYLRLASGKDSASWYHMTEAFMEESGGYIDRCYNWGYNRAADGTKADPGEPQLFWQMETRFRNNAGTPFGSECHLNFGRPTDGGVYSRPINVFMEHGSGRNQVALAGEVQFTDETANETLYFFPSQSSTGPPTIFKGKGLLLTGYPSSGPASGETYLQADSRFPALAFRNAGINKAILTADVQSGVFYLDANGGFVIRSGSPGFIATQIIAAAGQAAVASLLEFRASNQSTIYSRFSGNGYFMTRKNIAPLDSDLAPAEMAIWFDSTDGAAKLMVKAKQADGVVCRGSLSLS